jgi:hypothetical protein
MLLRNLFEAANNEVAIIFGRFNPPHKGHRAAWELASRSPVWFVGTNRDTVGPKDPLPFNVKIEAMKTVWPEVEGHIVAETSWLTLASKVYEKYPNAELLCFTDEDWVTKTIVQYNGKEGAHGFYKFRNIIQKPTPRLSSATALRDAVSKDDRAAFSQAAGVDADTKIAGTTFFDLVAKYLLPYVNVPKKVPAKKKKEPAATEGKKPEHNLGVGWMLDKDKKLGQKVAQNKAGARQERQTMLKYAGKKDLGKEQGVEEATGDEKFDTMMKKVAKTPTQAQRNAERIRQKREREEETRKHFANGGGFGPSPADKLSIRKGVAEAGSNAMSDTAKRLSNKDDGKVAKLRAAGDKRREEELKGRNIANRERVDLKTSLQELSNDMLGKYKKAAGADATKADKEGNVKRGDKRFSGIVKATNKQFANDAKKTK